MCYDQVEGSSSIMNLFLELCQSGFTLDTVVGLLSKKTRIIWSFTFWILMFGCILILSRLGKDRVSALLRRPLHNTLEKAFVIMTIMMFGSPAMGLHFAYKAGRSGNFWALAFWALTTWLVWAIDVSLKRALLFLLPSPSCHCPLTAAQKLSRMLENSKWKLMIFTLIFQCQFRNKSCCLFLIWKRTLRDSRRLRWLLTMRTGSFWLLFWPLLWWFFFFYRLELQWSSFLLEYECLVNIRRVFYLLWFNYRGWWL